MISIHMSHTLNSLKGGLYRRLYRVWLEGFLRGILRVLDYGSFWVARVQSSTS